MYVCNEINDFMGKLDTFNWDMKLRSWLVVYIHPSLRTLHTIIIFIIADAFVMFVIISFVVKSSI